MIITRKANLSPILEALEDSLCIIGDDYTIEYMNPAMIDLFGAGVGRKCYELINNSPKKCDLCASLKVFQGETVRMERFVTHLKKSFYVIGVPLKTNGETISKQVCLWKDITESKRQSEKIRSSEEDYARLFEHVGCGVFISTKDGKFHDANQALLDMLGYRKKKDFLKMDIKRDLYMQPGDRGIYQEMVERSGQVTDYELVLKTKNGKPIPISITSRVRYDPKGNVLGYEGIVVDLTQRKLMEKKLKEAYDFLDKIIQSSPNAIMATDMKGNIILWNQGAEEILGYHADELIGKKNIATIYPEGKLKNIMVMMRSSEYGGTGKLRSYPMVFLRRDREPVEGNFSAAILYDSDGNEIASVGLFVDLKERLKMEHKLRETQQQLFQAEKLASIGRLAAGVAHELNNPLGAITLYSHLVLEDLSKNNIARQNQEKVIFQADRCKKIVEGLLDFARQNEPENKSLDVNQVLNETLSLIEAQGLFSDIQVTRELDPDLPLIMGDKSQLQQVFVNITINATEAMEAGGALTVVSALDDDFVKISMTDTGCGLSSEDMDKIFEPFFTTKANQRGTGLGLAVSHGIINKHGGTISVQSKVNEGTTFTVRLPVQGKHSIYSDESGH